MNTKEKTKENNQTTNIYPENKAETVKYFVMPGTVDIEGERYVTYGIGVLTDNVMSDCVPDVSADLNTVKSMVSLFNMFELSATHLFDAIEDFL